MSIHAMQITNGLADNSIQSSENEHLRQPRPKRLLRRRLQNSRQLEMYGLCGDVRAGRQTRHRRKFLPHPIPYHPILSHVCHMAILTPSSYQTLYTPGSGGGEATSVPSSTTLRTSATSTRSSSAAAQCGGTGWSGCTTCAVSFDDDVNFDFVEMMC
jgi:hypothetical protein